VRNAAMQQLHGGMSQISDVLHMLRLNFDHLENSALPFVTRRTKCDEELSKGKTNVTVS
jgi:hypothetical protein